MFFISFGRFQSGFRLVVLLLASLLMTEATRADVLVWDTNTVTDDAQDGTGTWTVGAPNWFNQTQTLQNQVWVNGSDAVFGAGSGTAGTITLSGPITAGNLTFNAATSGSYTLGGSGTLTLVDSTITSNAAGAISAIIAGSTAWQKTGAGTLTLNGSAIGTPSESSAASSARHAARDARSVATLVFTTLIRMTKGAEAYAAPAP